MTKIEDGKDRNFFQELSIAAVTSYPNTAQTSMGIRGPKGITLICTAGTVYYSFNGHNDHGKMVTTEPSEKLEFQLRPGNIIWWRGTGSVEIHGWKVG